MRVTPRGRPIRTVRWHGETSKEFQMALILGKSLGSARRPGKNSRQFGRPRWVRRHGLAALRQPMSPLYLYG